MVDGNVERVLLRLFGQPHTKEATWQKAEALLDHERPGDFNQAMMELGATVCTPRAPQCLVCPVHSFCVTRGMEAAKTAGSEEEPGNALCPHSSRRFRAAGTARGGRVADGWDVGVADAFTGDSSMETHQCCEFVIRLLTRIIAYRCSRWLLIT